MERLRTALRTHTAVETKVREWLEFYELDVIDEAVDDLVARVIMAVEDAAIPAPAVAIATPAPLGCSTCGNKDANLILSTDHMYYCNVCATTWRK